MHKVSRLPRIDGDLGWFETAPDRQIRLGKRLKGVHQFDVAIIGAGFTGVSLAYRYAEINPGARIALIDALQIGQGTSGRNSGFIIDLPHNLDAGKPDVEHDRRLYQLNTFAIERLRQFKNSLDINCSWLDVGKYMAAHEERNLSGLDSFIQTLKASNFEYEVVEGKALEKRLGTNYYRAAVYTPGNVLVNPSALIRGLAAGLPKSVSLFEESPVMACEYGSPHVLKFVGGTIKAKVVVQAANSFNEEFGKLSNRIAPVFTYASLTEPLTDKQYSEHFKAVQPWGVTSAHPAGATVRFTADRRIFVRNMLDFEPGLQSTQEGLHKAWMQHRRSFEARFPFLKSMAFDFTWGGMLCMTLNHEPVFKDAGDGVYLLGGCNGVGVAKGTYLGYYMADHMNGIKSDNLGFLLANSKPSWVPPDPFRKAGARLRLKYESGNAGGDI